MRGKLIVANLFLMLLLVVGLQAQNHNNQGGYNNRPGHRPNPNQHHHQYRPQIREFTGVLVRQNVNSHNQNWNHHSNSHNRNTGFGIMVQTHRRQAEFLRLDEKGNRIVRDILRSRRNRDKKIYVKVKGYLDRSGTLNVVSLSKMNRPRHFAGFFTNSPNSNWNNNGWSFQLFVGLN
ncbi:MAG: hypothetical protein R6V77_02830 [Candidatus Cloacimonadaceae bacterium]